VRPSASFKVEQAATEISLTQPAEEGLPIGRSRKYREHGKRLVTMKEKYEVGDYTLKLSAVGCHLTVWLKYCVTIVLPSVKVPFQNCKQNQTCTHFVRWNGIGQNGMTLNEHMAKFCSHFSSSEHKLGETNSFKFCLYTLHSVYPTLHSVYPTIVWMFPPGV